MSLLSGLGKFGLDNMESKDLYEERPEASRGQQKPIEIQIKKIEEKDLVFEKKYTCPVCESDFTSLTVRTGKVRMVKADIDLRPVYDVLDEIKYDVISCPWCGYSTLARFYGNLMKHQTDAIKEQIGANFRPQSGSFETYSYETARDRYQLAIANAIVKKAKASEKAYLCLKTAWLVRGQTQSLDKAEATYLEQEKKLKAEEKELLQNALEGFLQSRQTENFPIAGMDQFTLDYLVAALEYETGDIAACKRMIGEILTSRGASSKLKDRTHRLKEIIEEEQKA